MSEILKNTVGTIIFLLIPIIVFTLYYNYYHLPALDLQMTKIQQQQLLIKQKQDYAKLLLVACVKIDYYKTLLVDCAETVRIRSVKQCCLFDKEKQQREARSFHRRMLYGHDRRMTRRRYPSKSVNVGDEDSRGIGVVWCVVGLLILSLIASVFDAMNATKKPQFKKMSSFDLAGKPGAAPRRCSLASLTAARHNRRQQYTTKRASSIAEAPSPPSSSNTPQAAGMPILRAKFD